MIDFRQLNTKEEYGELLRGLAERLPNVISNEADKRVSDESAHASKNAIDELIARMELLSHIDLSIDFPGTHEEQIARRGRSAIKVRDLMVLLDEFKKGKVARGGTSEFPHEMVAAIYYGSKIFNAIENERRDLAKYLITQPAPAPAPAPVDAPIEVGEE